MSLTSLDMDMKAKRKKEVFQESLPPRKLYQIPKVIQKKRRVPKNIEEFKRLFPIAASNAYKVDFMRMFTECTPVYTSEYHFL